MERKKDSLVLVNEKKALEQAVRANYCMEG
jgi:hypothetical protein